MQEAKREEIGRMFEDRKKGKGRVQVQPFEYIWSIWF